MTTICVGILCIILIVLRQLPGLSLLLRALGLSKSARYGSSSPVEPEVANIVILCGAGIAVLGVVMLVTAMVLRARVARAGAGPEGEAEKEGREAEEEGQEAEEEGQEAGQEGQEDRSATRAESG
ncbi:hypothetical protein GCM10010517_16820 [Streptosporangium fragile]|uniref:Uncharacterized protein n=1 Tax=Streptosporangium fragile TaxID=46186 RepID=A0ABP6IBM1_9ACTN